MPYYQKIPEAFEAIQFNGDIDDVTAIRRMLMADNDIKNVSIVHHHGWLDFFVGYHYHGVRERFSMDIGEYIFINPEDNEVYAMPEKDFFQEYEGTVRRVIKPEKG